MASELFLDFETRSEIDLTDAGLHNYVSHPSTKVLLLSFAFGDGQVHLWEPHKNSLPTRLEKALADPGTLKIAHNAGFEFNIFLHVMKMKVPLEQWRDTAAMARYLSLPGSLSGISEILKLDNGKIEDGERLIHLFSLPARAEEENTLFGVRSRFNDWESHPEDWAKFGEYCKRDTEVERQLYKMFQHFPLPENEWKIWQLDQKINQRGIPANMDFAEKVLKFALRSQEEVMATLREKTGLKNPNSVQQLIPWLTQQGYSRGSLNKLEVKVGCDKLTPLGKEVINLRAESSKTSFKKLHALKLKISSDGRLRNAFMYYGASRTGRWSGGGGAKKGKTKGVQFQNLPRPNKQVEKNLERAVQLIDSQDFDTAIKEFAPPGVPSVVSMATGCIRSVFQAPPGKKLVVCDLGAIENRVLGWMAGCEPILEVFRKNMDPYVAFGTKMFHQPYEVLIHDKEKRQIAKPAVLGCGYGLGHGTEIDKATGKRVAVLRLNKYGNEVKTGLIAYAENMGIKLTPDESYLAVTAFRKAYPEVIKLWGDTEDAVIRVLKGQGPQKVGFVEFDRRKRKDGSYILRSLLPSGRYLHYLNARIVTEEATNKKGEKYDKEVIYYDGIGHGVGATTTKIEWAPVKAYGGKFVENEDQGISRDVFVNGMVLADEIGMSVVLHCHDELGCEEDDVDFGFGLADLKYCMTQTPSWAPGLPLAAEGWEGKMYKKG
jgi:Casjensviridae DNA polymerase